MIFGDDTHLRRQFTKLDKFGSHVIHIQPLNHTLIEDNFLLGRYLIVKETKLKGMVILKYLNFSVRESLREVKRHDSFSNLCVYQSSVCLHIYDEVHFTFYIFETVTFLW